MIGQLASAALTEAGVAHQLQYAGSMFSIFFTDGGPVTNFAQAQATETFRFGPFFHAMLDAGVYLPPSAYETWFVSAALDDDADEPDRRGVAGRRPGRGPGGAVTVTTTRVHVLRHGEVFNPDKVLYGRLPGFRLSEAGRQMAELAARRWPGRDVTLPGVLAAATGPGNRGPDRGRVRAGDRHRRSADRGRQRLRGSAGQRAGTACSSIRRTGGSTATSSSRPGASRTCRWRSGWRPRCCRPGTRPPGHEAVCVSHQLPIVCLRRFNEHRHLWHDPRKRQCSLASLTTFVFDGDELTGIEYSEPAGTHVQPDRPAAARSLSTSP